MKKLILIAIVLMVGACGMNKPFSPTVQYINGSSATMPYGQQNGSYVMIYNLADAQLNWDVSNVPGAEGVKIVASKDYTCETEVASSILYIVNSAQRNTVVYGGAINPQENLMTVFYSSLSKFSSGRYFICVKAIKMGQESPPSYPVTIELMQNQVPMLQTAETTATSTEEVKKEEVFTKEKDPYFNARPENL